MGLMASKLRVETKLARKLAKNGSLIVHVGSIAIAVEALEALLVEKGVLKDDELMDRIKDLTQKHYAMGDFIPAAED
jgi:hypothetical protein